MGGIAIYVAKVLGIKALLALLLLSFGIATEVRAGLLGQTISGDFGINSSGGPFDPGFFQQIDFGTSSIGLGIEFVGAVAVDVDFTDSGVQFSDFGSGHLVLPFNGWRFVLQSPTVDITDVQLISTTIPNFTLANVFFQSDAIAINSLSQMNGDLELAITTRPIPEPSTMLLLSFGLAGLGFFRRRRVTV